MSAIIMAMAPAPKPAEEITWALDPVHSTVWFSASHLAINQVQGKFNHITGTVKTTKDDFSDAEVRLSIDANSIDTGHKDRDNHLRSAEFLDVAQFPKIDFVGKGLEHEGGNNYRMKGNLTLHGVTHKVEVAVAYRGTTSAPNNQVRAGFEVSATLNRFDYGLTWNNTFADKMLVGKDINITCNIELVKQES